MMIKRILFTIIFGWIFSIGICMAQSEDDNQIDETVVTQIETDQPDTALILQPTYFRKDSLQAWKKSERYGYMKNIDSILKASQAGSSEDYQKTNKGVGSANSFFSSGVFKVLLWIIAGLFVIYVLSQLFINKGLLRKNLKTTNAVSEFTEEEYIQQTDFDRQIENALANQNYQLATRFLFLKTLKLLMDKNFIKFGVDKTNSQYAREISGDRRSGFSKLALQYEYIWYGNLPINEQQFNQVNQSFKKFQQQL